MWKLDLSTLYCPYYNDGYQFFNALVKIVLLLLMRCHETLE